MVPCEVEEAIATLPGVVEVKVYAGQHRSGSQMVKAAVAVEDGITVAEIRAHCEQELVYYKRPQVINLVDASATQPGRKDRQGSVAVGGFVSPAPVFFYDREGHACRLPWLLHVGMLTMPGTEFFPYL